MNSDTFYVYVKQIALYTHVSKCITVMESVFFSSFKVTLTWQHCVDIDNMAQGSFAPIHKAKGKNNNPKHSSKACICFKMFPDWSACERTNSSLLRSSCLLHWQRLQFPITGKKKEMTDWKACASKQGWALPAFLSVSVVTFPVSVHFILLKTHQQAFHWGGWCIV